ncbi:unnamed protein product [Nyctereutes procyonoides]|uniref:(raccoon dog) hypothetical protein n=1 Tax=Nyctereutes procyonoides TaxID=34880 RepID=A0A811YZ82_NYCPR|nr:unnamed protein product [Nyctereutes procyonoides]
MAVEGRLTKKKMIDTASLFKQRRRSIGRGAGSRPAEAGERGLKVAPRGRDASRPPRPAPPRPAPPPRARARPPPTAPPGACLRDKQTSRTAGKPGGGGGGAGAAGPRVQVPALRCLARPLRARGDGGGRIR